MIQISFCNMTLVLTHYQDCIKKPVRKRTGTLDDAKLEVEICLVLEMFKKSNFLNIFFMNLNKIHS